MATKGFEDVKPELIRSINEQDFVYVGEGLIEVESYIGDYLLSYGYKLTSFSMQELRGSRRHLKIGCADIISSLMIGKSYFMELTVYDSPAETSY